MARNISRRPRSENPPEPGENSQDNPETEDVEEDAAQARQPRSRTQEESSPAGRGWGAYGKEKASSGDYAENLRITDEAILVKFLDPEPFVVYKQHWVERTGKKSFTCLGNGCPLCDDLGDRPRLQVAFNVLDLSESDPTVKVWTVGTRVAEMLKNYDQDKKTSPLNRENLYWAVSKSGTGTSTQYSVLPVKERDLTEDWGQKPLSATEIADFAESGWNESIVSVQSRRELQDIVDEQLGQE